MRFVKDNVEMEERLEENGWLMGMREDYIRSPREMRPSRSAGVCLRTVGIPWLVRAWERIVVHYFVEEGTDWC